jgi:hypothetical protein
MSNDRPDPLDRIIAQSRPQQGDPPTELNDPRNYLVFDRLPSAGALDDAATVLTTDRDGRLAVSDPGTVLGVVVEAVEPVTPEDVEAELADMRAADDNVGRDDSSYIPSWTAVSATPTLAPEVERPRLVRRNGTRVRPEWVIPLTRGHRTIPTRTRSPSSAESLSGGTRPARTGPSGARPRCSAPARS